MSFFAELKRRNVIRMAGLYVVGAWLVVQVAETLLPIFGDGFPAVAAGPAAGDFRLIWQDTRGGGVSSWNSWQRRTTNGGATWSAAVKLSDLATGAPYKSAAGYAFPYGDYLEIAVDGWGRGHFIWGAGASYTGPGGTWYTSGSN